MIEITGLSKRFGKLKVLDDVCVTLEKGRTISLVGPNGSGKTTMIKCILGLVIPDTGTIRMHNQNVLGSWNYRRNIGYMPQIGRYPDNMKIQQVLDMIREIRSDEQMQPDFELIEAFNIPQLAGKTMRSLSGGTRQKVSACLAFMFNPDVLILDEPTAGLDPLASEILKEKIMREKSKGKLILISSHVLSDLEELTSDVLYIIEGRVRLFQTAEELKKNTGENTLNKSIAHIMKNDLKSVGSS